MAEEKPGENDPDLAYLKAKANRSTVETVEAILETPEMKHLIRKTFVKEGLLQGFLMAFIFVGLMMVYNAFKAALNFGWQIDFIVGYFLILAGALYLWKRVRS
jgi:hypothetical protein